MLIEDVLIGGIRGFKTRVVKGEGGCVCVCGEIRQVQAGTAVLVI